MSPLNRNSPVGVSPLSEADCARLVSRIQDGDQTAKEEFTRLFSRGIRLLLCRKLQAADVEQGLQNTLAVVLREIETRKVFKSGQMISLVLATLKIQRSTLSQQDTCAQETMESEQCQPGVSELAKQHLEQVIRKMPAREREVLRRYYVEGEKPEFIRDSLDLPLAEVQRIVVGIRTRFRSLERVAGAS